MSANVVPFPSEDRKRAIVRDWLFLQMTVGEQSMPEAFALHWSSELCGTVRTQPQDMARMLGDLAAARETRP